MIIRELYIRNFGRFSDKNFRLNPGLNLIVGKNESGKSTLTQFVRAMLFGMKKGRGRAAGKDAFSHYAPWNGADLAGEMVFSCRDRTFRLRRAFPEGGSLFCLEDGETLKIEDGDLKMLLGGIEEGFYDHAVSTSCKDAEPSAALSEALEQYFLNLDSTKEDQADVQSALKYLKEQRKMAEMKYQIRYRSRQEQIEKLQNRIYGYEKDAKRIKERLDNRDEAEVFMDFSVRMPDGKRQTDTNKDTRSWPAEYLAAAMASIVMILFIGMDHLFPAVVMAVLGILFLFTGMIKERRDRSEGKRIEEEQRRLEGKVRREHLEETYTELLREQSSCQEALKDFWKPSEEEEALQMEMEACEEAARRIKEAAAKLVLGWGKRLEENASSILREITAGKYYGLKIGEHMDITVTNGERILRPDQLSYGTCSQIWMAVRLAAAMFLTEEPMPLVLDDAFLSWDEERTEGLLSWLAACGRQVLLFSGRETEERIIQRKCLPFSKIMLDE